jgi:hypothetical protein
MDNLMSGCGKRMDRNGIAISEPQSDSGSQLTFRGVQLRDNDR